MLSSNQCKEASAGWQEVMLVLVLVPVLVPSAAKVQQLCNLKRLIVTRMEFTTPHVVGKGGTPDSVSVPELQSIRREPWNNFCRQYGNRP